MASGSTPTGQRRPGGAAARYSGNIMSQNHLTPNVLAPQHVRGCLVFWYASSKEPNLAIRR
jgi:hypothetical protein